MSGLDCPEEKVMQESEEKTKNRSPEQAQRDLELIYRRMLSNNIPRGTFPITWYFLQPDYTPAEKEALKSFQREKWIRKSVGTGLSLNVMYYVCARLLNNPPGVFKPIGICAASVVLGFLLAQVDVQNKVMEMFPDGLAAWQVMKSRGMINRHTGEPYTDKDMQKLIFGRSFEHEENPQKAIAMFISGADASSARTIPKKEERKENQNSEITIDL